MNNNNGTDESTKDLTEDLSDRQLLLLLVERVGRLEAAEEDRKRETRPLWERLDGQIGQMIVRLANIEDEQRRMRHEMGLFREDLRNERMERSYLAARVDALERPERQ